MQSEISPAYQAQKDALEDFVTHFATTGENYGDQARNTLKLFELNGKTINAKSFKVPHLVNKIAYRFFRKSKAQRSFEYAHILLKKDIKTPAPVAYFQESNGLTFGKSFYLSEHLDYDLTYRELIHDPKFPNRYEILRQFTQFTFHMHQQGVEFLDHSPGNTLIVFNETTQLYDFYLVDLNRMKFHDTMDYETRIKNFVRLSPDKNMVSAMSAEYAKLIGKEFHTVFADMWREVENFRIQYTRRKERKKRLKFWKK